MATLGAVESEVLGLGCGFSTGADRAFGTCLAGRVGIVSPARPAHKRRAKYVVKQAKKQPAPRPPGSTVNNHAEGPASIGGSERPGQPKAHAAQAGSSDPYQRSHLGDGRKYFSPQSMHGLSAVIVSKTGTALGLAF